MPDEENYDVLSRFVLRARRIAAHSLAQDRQGLLAHARGTLNGTIDSSGLAIFTQLLPEDEEAFESLAARLRPLTLGSEPIYFEKVLDALAPHVSEAERGRFESLRDAWKRTEIQGVQTQGFSVQQSNKDGSQATGFVSDTQLAAAWLYSDLVHAHARGPKGAALVFPLHERYAAAVRIFSHIALLTLTTLELVMSMTKDGRVHLDPDAEIGDVIVGVKELTHQARAFFADQGAEPPDLRVTSSWPEDWKQLTIMEVRRQNPANHVRVELRRGDELIAAYDAAVLRRDMESVPAVWDVLVADSMVFKFLLDIEEGGRVKARSNGYDQFEGTNALALGSSLLQAQASEADTIGFHVLGSEMFRLEVTALDVEELRELRVVAEVLTDIVAIERLLGEELAVCKRFDNRDRVLLRRARMLHEGRLIRTSHGPLAVTTSDGGLPQAAVTPASQLDIGGTLIPVPETMRWHPAMSVEPDPAAGPKSFAISLPEGERFLTWAPERLSITPKSEQLEVADYEQFVEFDRDPSTFD